MPTIHCLFDPAPLADGVYTITAESYGDGIMMWLGAQGDKVQNIR